MKKVGNHNSFSRIYLFSIALLLTFPLTTFAQNAAPADTTATTKTDAAPAASGGGDAAKGKELFNANCAACHNLDKKMTATLRGVRKV